MRSKRSIVALMGIMVCGFAIVAWWLGRPGRVHVRPIEQATGDPHGFVDESRCAECHPDRAATHQLSGHADTFRPSGDSEIARQLSGRTFVDSERRITFQYQLDDEGPLLVSLVNQLGERQFPLHYVLGSGHNAVSFLSLVPDGLGDTVGIEHRVSMYRGLDDWEIDLTPGHRGAIADEEVELLGKVVRGDTLTGCIGCHTVTAEIRGHELIDLRSHVGCQSCHGPGGGHVAEMLDGATSENLSGYFRLKQQSAADEIALCGRCHRLPADQPAANLSPNIIQNVRFQPAGLIQSKCYIGSQDLRCSTCHDPHEPVSRDQGHYVQRCLDCHRGGSKTTCPVSPQGNCIDCHMPAIDVHRGIEFHDHWIRIRADRPGVE